MTIALFIAVVLSPIISCNDKMVPVTDIPKEAHQAGQTYVGPKIAIGESYCGGIIFHVATSGKHGLIAPGRQVLYAKWGSFR